MQTQQQKESSCRNWKIFSIRGMYAAILKLDIPIALKEKVLFLIDEILVYYGALPEQEHRRIVLDDPTYKIEL